MYSLHRIDKVMNSLNRIHKVSVQFTEYTKLMNSLNRIHKVSEQFTQNSQSQWTVYTEYTKLVNSLHRIHKVIELQFTQNTQS